MDNKEKNINYFAAVIGDWHFNSLGIVRSLGEAGVEVIFINLSEGGYSESSKYVKSFFNASNSNEVIKLIVEATEKFNKKAVLFPAGDEAALIIDEHRSTLEDCCICPGFKGDIADYMNKDNMCSLASESGFSVPQSLNLRLDGEFKENLRAFPLPLIIKPLKSVDGSKADIMVCQNKEQLEVAVKTLSEDDSVYNEVLVQQFVDGKNNLMVEYCGCKTPGRKVSIWGQLEKIREYPVNRGSTTYAVIKEEITYINTDTLDSFLEKSGFSGIFDLELKVVDGTPYFLEINYRNGAPSYGFTKAGFNIPLTWFCQQTGITEPHNSIKELYLMSERDDLNNVKDKNISVFKWLKDIKNTDTMMIYNPLDPAPFKNAYNSLICKLFSLLQKKG